MKPKPGKRQDVAEPDYGAILGDISALIATARSAGSRSLNCISPSNESVLPILSTSLRESQQSAIGSFMRDASLRFPLPWSAYVRLLAVKSETARPDPLRPEGRGRGALHPRPAPQQGAGGRVPGHPAGRKVARGRDRAGAGGVGAAEDCPTETKGAWSMIQRTFMTPITAFRGPTRIPVRLPCHEVENVQHFWLEVNAIFWPMVVREEPFAYYSRPRDKTSPVNRRGLSHG